MTGFVVMGVSGCGKSLIGARFAAAIGSKFIDGDDLHPESNVAKMRRGEPLDDADRAPWLARVGAALADKDTVIACSALKRSYRDQIRLSAGGPVAFLFLRGTREDLFARLTARQGHFMPVSLLDSQMATLEPPSADEWHLTQDVDQTPERIVENFIAALKEKSP